MITRRNFLKRSAMAVAATSVLPSLLYSCENQHPLGIQLYSLRDTIGDDVEGTLAQIAKVGFKEVEPYGYSPENEFWGVSVNQFKNMLDANGLSSPSGHYELGTFLSREGTRSDFAYTVDIAKKLGQKYIVIPHISENLRTNLDDYKRLAEKMNEAGEICKNADLKLAYHNHAFEFEEYDGTTGFQVLLNNTDKDLVDFEMDIYWVVRGGKDPVAMMQANPGRFPLWHVKDMSKTNHELNTEIGSGTIDYKEIFQAAKKAGAKHFILEQENFEMEPYKSLAQSYKYMKEELLG